MRAHNRIIPLSKAGITKILKIKRYRLFVFSEMHLSTSVLQFVKLFLLQGNYLLKNQFTDCLL